ncbi:hypothetical protein PAXRUDRAFT_22676 [Paxillus rubicundulus Ve08.2h10]|uniref:Uncharacterized protein n=1 Tax=Paxillus rubicundulus Ve08.2h10 TaxID=930991 RepID=A0A0D0C8E1_9AGAM|nr:hypothetical protein PAXRUDRAFT_22676 [Paxillus rubicundulus Ve08.2h10]
MLSESDASKNSRNSQASIHSLCSRGTVDLTSLKKSKKPSSSSQQAVMEIQGRPHSMKLPLS